MIPPWCKILANVLLFKPTGNFCSEKFPDSCELMRHKKLTHIEKVQLCIQFTGGDCTYGESCWFSHESSGKKLLYEFKCNHCEEKFQFKSSFMRHKKLEHSELVANCKYESLCQYSSQTCLFKHKNIENENDQNEIQTNKMIQKVIEMVDKYSERIITLEKKMVK